MLNNNYYIYILIRIISRTLCVLIFFLPVILHAQDQDEIQLANEYVLKGEKTKAIELYRDLAKSDANIPFIHNNYLNLMLDLGTGNEAQDYLKRILKKDPENIQYRLDMGIVYVKTGDVARADRYFKDIINTYKANITRSKIISDYLASRSLVEYAIQALEDSRKFAGNPYLFSLELAMLYRIHGEKDKMVNEYLTYVTQTSANTQYVKNVMQALLTKPEELESLERLLFERVQKNPEVEVYTDLLIWVNMQQKNFYGAMVQSRAFDRRFKKFGEKTLDVARVALDNEDYENAYKSYSFVAREFPNGPFVLQAELGMIKTREARVRNTFPVQRDSVQNLVTAYKIFIERNNVNASAYEAQRNLALLYANYLDQKDEAIVVLTELSVNTRATLQLRSKAKLDLGDIYLLKGEPWESTLLYSQVEKALRENPVGYEAKLKNAKLSYFKGDFLLAQEHLDILKEATTREIANDAMELSLRIKENIALDSAGEALKAYAEVELLLFQNKYEDALKQLSLLKEGKRKISTTEAFEFGFNVDVNEDSVSVFATQTILDDVYWLEANLRMQRGEFEQSIQLLQKILDEYPTEVLADDAYFLQAEIYDRQLNNKDKAMEYYREFLTRFPGSVYSAEARKRFRTLRGDFQEIN